MTRSLLVSAAAVIAAFPCAAQVHAQGMWDAILTVQPYPTPYYSDWDANPDISTLTLINTTADAQLVRLHFNVTDHGNRVVVSGSSEPELIAGGATVIYDSPYDVAGSTTHDTGMEEVAARTGRMPEGDYTACAVAVDASGFVLAESCAPFTIVYPDPPLLIGPMDGDVVEQPDPLFTWTPVQVPIDYQLSYVLRVVEVLPDQQPAQALRENIPHYETVDARLTSLRYAIDAQPFENGKTYAWSVQALDQNGYAAAGNEGRSEIGTFRYDDGTVPTVTTTASSVQLSVRNAGAPEGEDAPADTVSGLFRICTEWDHPAPVDDVVYPMETPFAFPPRLNVDVELARDTVPGSNAQRVWALYGMTERFAVMLAGDCGLTNRRTLPRWIAIRTAGDAQELRDWVPGDTLPWVQEQRGARLKFGVAVLSRFEETIGSTASLAPVQEFLEGYEIDIKPGITLFGVLDARQLTRVWPLLEAFGHDAETAEIELQGFAGVNRTLAVEGRIGSEEVSGGVGATNEYLTLSARLPERELDSGPIRTIRTGIELSFGDSMGVAGRRDLRRGDTEYSQDTDLSWHPLIKLTVEAVTTRDVTWTGALEIDIGIDTERQVDTKPTLRLTTDHAWQPWENVDLALGNPEAAIAINDGLFDALKSLDQRQLDIDLTLRGSLILFDEDVAKLAVTFGRHALNDSSMDRTQARITAAELLDTIAAERMAEADARGDSSALQSYREKRASYREEIATWRRQLAADSAAVAAARDKPGDTPKPAMSDGGFYWRASLTLGSMSLVNLFDLTGNIVRALAARREGR